MYGWRLEAHVGSDTEQIRMGTRHSAYYHPDFSTAVQQYVSRDSEANASRWRVY